MERVRTTIEHVRAVRLRTVAQGVIRGYADHDLLTFASAIAFQVLFALIPLALFGFGLLGGLGLQEQWTRQWGPEVRHSMSPAAFAVLDDTVMRVLGRQQVFWMTGGAVLAVWKVSTATRAIMDVFDRIYGSRRSRSFAERLWVSLVLGSVVGALLLCAAASVVLGDDVLHAIGVVSPVAVWLRWPVALAFMFGVVAFLIARAPAERRPLRWVTFGSVVVVASWVATSVVLAAYLTSVADYGSVFAALATVVVVLTYLYAASAAVLTGAEIDALLSARLADDAGAGSARESRSSLSPRGDGAPVPRTETGPAVGTQRR